MEPRGWAPKSDEEGLLRDTGAECQRVQWGELSLFSQRHKDFGAEIIGEGVQISGLGDQKDRDVITEQERRRNGPFGGYSNAGRRLARWWWAWYSRGRRMQVLEPAAWFESGPLCDLQVSYPLRAKSPLP